MKTEWWRQTDVKNWVMSDEWWVMSDEWWVMEIEWRKLSDEKSLPKQALSFLSWEWYVFSYSWRRFFQLLINALKDSSPLVASFGLLIQDFHLFAEHFHCISFSHICRNGNSIAHNLIRHARHVTSSLVWIEDVPPQV